jgi:hypothetical protein
MKAIAISLLTAWTLHAGQTVADFQWKKRLLVVTRADEALGKQLADAPGRLCERDVEVFVLNGPVGPGKRPTDELATSLRELLKLDPAEVDQVILLGKDSRTTVRWKRTEFSPNALFRTIDAMPMRRRDMGRN